MPMILVVGPSMSGKSVSVCTFPKPMLYLDYDGNFASVTRTKNKEGKLVVPDWDQILRIPMTKTTSNALNFKTDLLSKSAPVFTNSSIPIYKRYNDIVEELEKKQGVENDKGEITKFKTLVIDSLTQMFTIWREVVCSMNGVPVPRIPDYMTMGGQMVGAFIPTLNSFLTNGTLEFIILVDHTQIEKDEVTGMVDEFPIGPSKDMGRNLGKLMDDVLYQRIEGDKRVWKTKPVGFFKYAGSRHNIPDGTEALYSAVEQYFK